MSPIACFYCGGWRPISGRRTSTAFFTLAMLTTPAFDWPDVAPAYRWGASATPRYTVFAGAMTIRLPVGVPVPVSTNFTIRFAEDSVVTATSVTFAPETEPRSPRKPTGVGPGSIIVIPFVHVPPDRVH